MKTFFISESRIETRGINKELALRRETISPKKEREKEILILFYFATFRCRLILFAVASKELFSLTANA